jgi:hypothetical protein
MDLAAWAQVGLTAAIVLTGQIYSAGKQRANSDQQVLASNELKDSIKGMTTRVDRIDRTVAKIKGRLGMNGDDE